MTLVAPGLLTYPITMWPVGAPVVVVEGSGEAFQRAIDELGRAGWRISAGFPGLGGRPWAPIRADLCSGAVATAEEAAAALLAVLGGSGVVIHGTGPRDVLDRLLDDLRHIGAVDHRRLPASGQDVVQPALDPEALRILELLAAGRRLGEAAAELGLSRRTADRRLAEARAALGVERTVEAVARARRMGWIGEG